MLPGLFCLHYFVIPFFLLPVIIIPITGMITINTMSNRIYSIYLPAKTRASIYPAYYSAPKWYPGSISY